MRESILQDPRQARRAMWLPFALTLGGLGFANARMAVAQAPSRAPANPFEPAAVSGREAQLEERIRQLEALIQKMPDPERVRRLEAKLQEVPDPGYVRKLEATVERLSTQVEQLSTRVADSESRVMTPAPGPSRPGATTADGPPVEEESSAASEEVPGGAAAAVSPAALSPSSRFNMPEPLPDIPLRARFGPGFEFKTEDDDFNLQVHDLTQLDGRFYQQANQSPVADTFTVPRQWFVFNGHLTRPYEYYVSIAEGFDAFNILDVFLNVNYDPRIQLRFGRFKTPFTYEFYAEPTQALANGEWSLFFNNFGFNRDLGGMLWGQLFQDRLDYAAGIFNSTRNGLLDFSDPKTLIAFANLAPFEQAIGSPWENFNLGGSVVAGDQQHVPIPQVLRTIVPTVGNGAIGVPFLAFNDNVRASGAQAFWSLHMAYLHVHLSLIGEWQSGFQDYALAGRPGRSHLPVESFYIQAAYLLTGERVASRGLVKPLRPFDLRKGRFGPGAWELAGRYSQLDLGNQVFTHGLADPNLWTNRLFATDLGLSWYWNQYIRVLFDWQHAEFGSPVLFRPGARQKTSDLFLIRFQIWF